MYVRWSCFHAELKDLEFDVVLCSPNASGIAVNRFQRASNWKAIVADPTDQEFDKLGQ